jgi:hypothetical protein
MAADSSSRNESLPVNYGRYSELGLLKAGVGASTQTLLFSEPARSTKLIFPFRTDGYNISPLTLNVEVNQPLFCCVNLTSSVKIACDREDSLLRRVDPTERCLFAVLMTKNGQARIIRVLNYAYVYSLLNSLISWIGIEDRFATKTWPASFSLTGNLGAYRRRKGVGNQLSYRAHHHGQTVGV